MYKGLIYKYISPSGKIYIGQTINENKRRRTFKNINMRYAGGKIDLARVKYSPENFKYSVIETIETQSKKELFQKLNELEIYYIQKYNSFYNGYNSTLGGTNGHEFTEEQKTKISDSLANKVVQYDLDGNFIRIWKSCREIEHSLGYSRIPIQNCCRGEIQHSREFIWRYFDENNFQESIEGIKENKNKTKKQNIILKQESITKVDKKIFKRILQYNLLGSFVKEWPSIKEAANFYNAKPHNISQCCNEVSKTSCGYIWKFYQNNYPLNIEVNLSNSQLLKASTLSKCLKVYKCDLKGNILNVYNSVKEASQDNSLLPTQITDCLSNRRKTCKNFIWKYELEYNTQNS